MNHEEIAKQFLNAYYTTLSNNRMEVINFFTEDSCMTYEGDSYKGIKAISEKLESMNYGSVRPGDPD